MPYEATMMMESNYRRRDLLAFGSAFAGGILCAGNADLAWAVAPAKRRFTIDLTPGAIGVKADLKGTIELAGKHGFESVAPSANELEGLSDQQSNEIVGLLKKHHLVWGAAGLPVEFRKDETKFQDDVKSLAKRCAAMKRAGVTRVSTWIMPCHDELTYVANFKQHASRLRTCAEILADHGQRLGLEYVGTQTLRNSKRYPFVHSMKETAELHNEIGARNVGFVLDSWHWYTAGETAGDIQSLDANQVVACDLNDAPKGLEVSQQIDNQRELPLATGVIDVQAFLNALTSIGYDGPVRAEPFNALLNKMNNDEACRVTSQALRNAMST